MNKLERMPIVPLKNITVFPHTSISVEISAEKSINALKHSLDKKQRIVVVQQKDAESENPLPNQLYTVGTLAEINKISKTDVDEYRVQIDAISVVDIGEFYEDYNYLCADVYERLVESNINEEEFNAYKGLIVAKCKRIEDNTNRHIPKHVKDAITDSNDLDVLINILSGILMSKNDKQKLLEETDLRSKAELACKILSTEVDFIETISAIEQRVQEKIIKNNKDYLMREHIKEIQNELGDDENDTRVLLEKVESLTASDEVKEKLKKDIERLSRLNDNAPESAILRNYMEWVLELPWDKVTKDLDDLCKVMDVLDHDHYGISKVKERIVEYLAVRILTKGKSRGTALCLVGPPGVGKTSIAKSIARALGKEFVQLTLGGVHDEAEIRGHRKTYIGAMPGRIMSSLSKSKANNPLFLLDEVDKITRDMRGDPSSALLEVLDPNQNKTFRDNYLEIPYDLSQVMFVLTANDLKEMDRPLLDRLEIIEMEGYTVEEKVAIASKYLITKQCAEHGIDRSKLVIKNEVIKAIIEGYTLESGVRELERKIASICRKIAYELVLKSKGTESGLKQNKKIQINVENLNHYLGNKTNEDIIDKTLGEVGKVTGLAWTALGGTTLDIEVCIMPGKGELKLTGKLGEVMRESAITAISVIRANSEKYAIDKEFFATNDIHIHVPKGAVSKDGPSAGVTIATAVLSAILNKKTKDKVAMTGEISLSGKVLAIGGLKEKSLAACRVGIETIYIPKQNEKDMRMLPDSVKKAAEFVLVENINEIFDKVVLYED